MITYKENSVIIDINKRNERRLMTKTKRFLGIVLAVMIASGGLYRMRSGNREY